MDIDPECNYCPTCHDEYRPEISTCAACGVAYGHGSANRRHCLWAACKALRRGLRGRHGDVTGLGLIRLAEDCAAGHLVTPKARVCQDFG